MQRSEQFGWYKTIFSKARDKYFTAFWGESEADLCKDPSAKAEVQVVQLSTFCWARAIL